MSLSKAEINQLKKALSIVNPQLPSRALQQAIQSPEDCTPMLLEALQDAIIKRNKSLSASKSRLALHALYLLTQFKSPEAWPLVLKLFTSMSSQQNIAIGNDFDEVVCDQLSQIFATLCSDDIRPLQSIIENSSVDEYVRDAALGALVTRYLQGDLALTTLTTYLHQLFEYGLEQERNQIWNAWVQACYNTNPAEFETAFQQLYEWGWAEDYYITLDELKLRYPLNTQRIKKIVLKEEGEFYRYISDAMGALRKLSCYSGEQNELLNSLENMIMQQTVNKGTHFNPLEELPSSVGRNDPCPCGSGKKFKKCCLH